MADTHENFKKAMKQIDEMNKNAILKTFEETEESRPDYESECKRLMEKMAIMREENIALTQAVRGLSVALDMSKKQRM